MIRPCRRPAPGYSHKGRVGAGGGGNTARLDDGLSFFIFVDQYSYITFVLSEAPYRLSSDWLGLLFLTYLTGTQAAAWVTRQAKTARASATSLYLTFYYAGATLGGFYLDPFWHQAGWQGVVTGSLLVLAVTLGAALWLDDRERAGRRSLQAECLRPMLKEAA